MCCLLRPPFALDLVLLGEVSVDVILGVAAAMLTTGRYLDCTDLQKTKKCLHHHRGRSIYNYVKTFEQYLEASLGAAAILA